MLSLSSSMTSRSSTRFSRKSAPREAWMYFLAWERVLSGLEERISSSFRKTSREAWMTGGSADLLIPLSSFPLT